MRLGVLFSGGKDSCLATLKALEAGHDVVCLMTMESRNLHSFMFHTPSVSQVRIQAKAAGLPLVVQHTDGVEEVEVDDLYGLLTKAISEYGIEGVVTGAVFSVYQASRVQRVCNGLGLTVFNPLWLMPQEDILRELVDKKFEVIVDGVFAQGLDKRFLGRLINSEFISEINRLHDRLGIEVAGEGGEYETCCLFAPWFSSHLHVSSFRDYTDSDYSHWRELTLEVRDG